MSNKAPIIGVSLIASILIMAASQARAETEIPCQTSSRPSSDVFIVTKGAVGTVFSKCRGLNQVSYKINIGYPAMALTDEISRRLEEKGWKPLQKSDVNQEGSTWMHFLDGLQNPIKVVHQWSAEWENSQGDIIQYALRYEVQMADQRENSVLTNTDYSNLTHLSVMGQLIPASTARLIREDPEHPKALLDIPDLFNQNLIDLGQEIYK